MLTKGLFESLPPRAPRLSHMKAFRVSGLGV